MEEVTQVLTVELQKIATQMIVIALIAGAIGIGVTIIKKWIIKKIKEAKENKET